MIPRGSITNWRWWRGECIRNGRRKDMLVLSRKVGERILIGENISVTVVRVAGNMVRIGVDAPTELPVVREELKIEMDAERDAKSRESFG